MRDLKTALLKLVEECAEVQQAALKIVNFGMHNSWPPGNQYTNRDHFILELGDLLAVASVVQKETSLNISDEDVKTAIENKMKKLEIYLPHIDK